MPRVGVLQLCGDGVPRKVVERLAKRFELPTVSEDGPGSEEGASGIVLLSSMGNAHLAKALRPPYVGCIETHGEDTGDIGPLLAALAEGGGLFVSLTTAGAFKVDLALHFIGALTAWDAVPEDLTDDIELALQEAVSNGLVHGNLEMDSSLRRHPETFAAYTKLMGERLADPVYGNRRMEVLAQWDAGSLEITVRDHGAGYGDVAVATSGATGRGLKLIKSVAHKVMVSDNGRTIAMRFSIRRDRDLLRFHGADAASPKDCRILVVEDNKGNQRIISIYLTAVGYHHIAFADNGVEGLSKVATFKPDLILLDLMMPEMDGYEFLLELRKTHAARQMPVLVQTALKEPEERARAFKAGATDLVTKPINGAELLSRVGIHLENKCLIRSLDSYRARVMEELRVAQEMQIALLPTAALLGELEKRLGLTISGHFEASSELGGDLWGVQRFRERKVGVFIVDFAGHGVTAALNTFRLHALLENLPPAQEPCSYLEILNQRLVDLLPTEQYATMFYGVIDTVAQKLTYAASASPSPMVGCIGEGEIKVCDPSGLPLGISKRARYENREVDFKPGSYLLLYSDALTESQFPNGGCLGEEGVVDLLGTSASTHGARLLVPMMESFHEKVRHPLSDDLSAVFVHWKE